MNDWMSWKQFRRLLRAKGMSKVMSGIVMTGIIDGVPFELSLNGRIIGRWIAEGWMVRSF